MVNPSPPNSNQGSSDLSEMQAELLQSVLTEQSYPWSPAQTADGYEEDLEAAGQTLEISEEEAAAGWQGLSTQLDQIWAGSTANSTVSVLALLKQKFAARIPESVLATIGDRATQTQQTTYGLADGAKPMVALMIDCVKGTVSAIGEADLQVIARPMAFAMRSSGAEELVEATAASVRTADWESLSALEQAKLSLAAARYAIAQLER